MHLPQQKIPSFGVSTFATVRMLVACGMIMTPSKESLTAILDALPAQFRAAMEANRELMEWWRQRGHRPIGEFLERYSSAVETARPYSDAYRTVCREFPEAMGQVHALLLPIQDEYTK
jgi:hypothetical protein